MNVGQAFALGDFVASKNFNFDPFVVIIFVEPPNEIQSVCLEI